MIFRDGGYLLHAKPIFFSLIKIKRNFIKKAISLTIFFVFFILTLGSLVNIISGLLISIPNLISFFIIETNYNIGYIFRMFVAPIIVTGIILNFRVFVNAMSIEVAVMNILAIFIFSNYSTLVIFWLVWVIYRLVIEDLIKKNGNRYQFAFLCIILIFSLLYDKIIINFINSYAMNIATSIIWAIIMALFLIYFFILPHIKWYIIKKKLLIKIKNNNGICNYKLLFSFIVDNINNGISNDKLYNYILKYIKKYPLTQQLLLTQQFYKILIERKIFEELLKTKIINQIKMLEKELLSPKSTNY